VPMDVDAMDNDSKRGGVWLRRLVGEEMSFVK
jgi:hypothetical protein